MTRGVRLYLVGSFVLVSLAGCGRGFFQSAEREPWRAEAEIACLKSGAVKENAELVRIDPISGPGVCGAEFPLKVAALGESSGSFGFADENLRPPAQYRQSAALAGLATAAAANGGALSAHRHTPMARCASRPMAPRPSGPISLAPPGVAPEEDDIELPPEGAPGESPPQPRTVSGDLIRRRPPIRRATARGALFAASRCRAQATGAVAAARTARRAIPSPPSGRSR